MFGANLVFLAQIADELSRGQAEFPRILSQNGQNDFEGQAQWPPFESIPWCMFDANLEFPAQICEELSTYHTEKVKFTNRRVEGGTGNDNTPSIWKVKGSKMSTLLQVHWLGTVRQKSITEVILVGVSARLPAYVLTIKIVTY